MSKLTVTVDSMTDAQWAQFLGRSRINRAAQRRAHAAERAAAIAALGWEPEDGTVGGRYCASTSELLQLLAERG